MNHNPVVELALDVCGVPNPRTGDTCVLLPGHELYERWHKDGHDQEWMGKSHD